MTWRRGTRWPARGRAHLIIGGRDQIAWVILGLIVFASGCGSAATRFAERAEDLGFIRGVVPGNRFDHAVFRRPARGSPTVHIYLDGDGTPWRRGGPVRDPTPRRALVLDLMRVDPTESIYLGRPCYHGVAHPQCRTALWIDARYSAEVVDSMAAAARGLISRHAFEQVIWFGYSGGGALAMLLAARIPQTVAVVTVAANLDIDAWTDLHGYSRLSGSLNPAAQPPLAASVYQRHYVGENDRNVTPAVVARAALPAGSIAIVEGYDHTCCWERLWPAVLRDLASVTGLP